MFHHRGVEDALCGWQTVKSPHSAVWRHAHIWAGRDVGPWAEPVSACSRSGSESRWLESYVSVAAATENKEATCAFRVPTIITVTTHQNRQRASSRDKKRENWPTLGIHSQDTKVWVLIHVWRFMILLFWCCSWLGEQIVVFLCKHFWGVCSCVYVFKFRPF